MYAKSGVILTCVLGVIAFNPAVVQQFVSNQIVPDVIDIAPKMQLSVINKKKCSLQSELTKFFIKIFFLSRFI